MVACQQSTYQIEASEIVIALLHTYRECVPEAMRCTVLARLAEVDPLIAVFIDADPASYELAPDPSDASCLVLKLGDCYAPWFFSIAQCEVVLPECLRPFVDRVHECVFVDLCPSMAAPIQVRVFCLTNIGDVLLYILDMDYFKKGHFGFKRFTTV